MFNKLAYTWNLMGASWRILSQDKEMLLFPLLSGVCCLLVLASFAIPIWATDAWQPPARDADGAAQIVYYGVLFLFYLCNYFVITFFNAAIVSCAVLRMQGGDPTLGDGFREAFARLPVILGWALVSATVGLILRAIEDRSEKIGRFVAGLLGMAWTLVSYLVVPIIVVERKGPLAALKSSTGLLKKTWGEQLVGNFSFGAVFCLLALPAWVLIGLGIYLLVQGNAAAIWICGGVAVVYLIALSLVQSALQSIFRAAVYLYATGNSAPPGFPPEMLSGAMSPK